MGFFVVFEGDDGTGKSTQVDMLASALKEKGFSVFVSKEPGGPEFGEAIRDILLNPKFKGKVCSRAEMFLYMASRAQHTEEWIIPKLKEVDFYISSRYALSSVAYQGHGRGLLEEVKACNKIATQGVNPDLTIVFTDSPDKCIARVKSAGRFDRLEQEPLSFHEKVRQGFLREAALFPDRIKVIPFLDNEPKKMHELVLNLVLGLVKEKRN